MKYYVVLVGRATGIYCSRDECKQQISGYKGAVYKSFLTKESAEFALKQGVFGQKGQSSNLYLRQMMGLDFDLSICTDASCSSNPGPIEWRAVDIATGQELFMYGPCVGGTINLAEFFALVDAMKFLLDHMTWGHKKIIYSDSDVALGRIQKKSINTMIGKNNGNDDFVLNKIEFSLSFLNKYSETLSQRFYLRKRPTVLRGQIPADFGRK